ncbi:MAG: D-serine deaminase-like pyridoxal phosphate-dependent protein [Limisphaerales bacterium]|jgi:D-serine deaminase-like pyridoxal phosphate-dependent protein
MLHKITTPTLLLDEQKSRRNIAKMAAKASASKAEFRPHFKTHVSKQVGLWYKEYGVSKITVSSVQMAEYFADDWDDILIAFPVNILEIDRINNLANKVSLHLVVESLASIEFLKTKLSAPVFIWIKIDAGYNRTGIKWDKQSAINEVHNAINGKLVFKGFLAHSGHSYGAGSIEEIQEIHKLSMQRMFHLKSEYPQASISLGDTPTCSVVEDFEGLDELRPGNLVFYDLAMQKLAVCEYEDIAVALACPVVAVHSDQLTIYGGGVHFSKDVMHDPRPLYGRVVDGDGLSWNKVIPNVELKKISQEHGIITGPSSYLSSKKVGDIVKVLPVHSCMTADLMTGFLTTDGNWIEKFVRANMIF